MTETRFFRTTAPPDLANSSGRIIRYQFSTPAVARDQHTIQAWRLDNFRLNPVFLWAHQGKEPPIGKVIEVEDNKGYLTGTVEYAERDVYPFADMVFQMVRGGFLNAVSTSWDPIDWKFTTDRSRPGGIDFKLVDLLELSQVPVPALPTAVATARAHGIDTAPLFDWCEKVLDEGGMMLVPRGELEQLRREAKMPAAASRAASEWKVGASRNLPLNEDEGWDGPAAEKSIFDKAGFDGDKPDTSFARKGFLVYDASAPEKKGSYKLPFAKVIDGRLTALASGIKAAASRLPQADIPNDVRDSARAVIDHYEGQMNKGKSDDEKRAARRAAFKRDLGQVAWLAYLLSDLDFLQDAVEWEAAIEEDGSPIPGKIAAVKKELGEILVAMMGEEVEELIDDDDAADAGAANADVDEGPRAKRNALGMLRSVKAKDASAWRMIAQLLRAMQKGEEVTLADGDAVKLVRDALARVGKALSEKNETALRAVHEHMKRGCDMLDRCLDDMTGDDENDDDDNDDDNNDDDDNDNNDDGGDADRALRARKARALKLKLAAAVRHRNPRASGCPKTPLGKALAPS